LIHYAEDLMAAQVERGHHVAYFCAGRHHALSSRTRLKRWGRGGVAIHEVVNGPIVTGLELGTRYPELDLDEPWLETAFREVLRSFQPDVVHFQELLCLPSSLIEVAAAEGVGTVMTLQDYFPLCSTLRLFDADGQFCERLEVGEECAARNAAAPATRDPFVEDTHLFAIARWRDRLRIRSGPRARLFYEIVPRIYGLARGVSRVTVRRRVPSRTDSLATAFQRRRDVNVARLSTVGQLVAQSPRVAEIYEARGVVPDRMTVLRFTLAHIERMRPRALAAPPSPLTFVTLGGCAVPSKGSHVIAGALRALREAGLEGRFRLRVLGAVWHEIRAELEGFRGVEIAGRYDREELDALLDDVDIGIVPSIWEEAFGYSGVELLAKGIPLIANPLGGIVEYAREGETAWLNDSCTGEGLAELMARLIDDPAQVVDMHNRVVASRGRIVRSMAEHVDAMEGVYRDAARRFTAA
jgi:glycosyltransferase involved in cell wall biosynthesis